MLLTLTGGSGAGKTTLAAAFEGAVVLHGDDYYVTDPGRGVWRPDRDGTPRLDVGDPRSMDLALLTADTATALAGADLVIVEGLFAFHVGSAGPRFDVFVDLAADLRLARKIHRKCVRDGFPLDVLLANYLGHRREAHERHVEPVRHRCDLIVDGGRPAAEIRSRILDDVAAARRR